jgi:hypothetical protein
LTRNAAAKNQKIQSWLPSDSTFALRSESEKLISPVASETRIAVAIAPTSISSEPTSV